jgi:hypothetical protein
VRNPRRVVVQGEIVIGSGVVRLDRLVSLHAVGSMLKVHLCSIVTACCNVVIVPINVIN